MCHELSHCCKKSCSMNKLVIRRQTGHKEKMSSCGSGCAAFFRLAALLVLVSVQPSCSQLAATTSPAPNAELTGTTVEIQCDIMGAEGISVPTSWFIDGESIANFSLNVSFELSGERTTNLTIRSCLTAVISCGVPQDVFLANFTLNNGAFSTIGSSSALETGVSTCVAVFDQSVSGAGNCLEAPSDNSTAVLCCGTVAPNDTTCAFGLCISCIGYDAEVGFEKVNYTVVEGDTEQVCVSLRGGMISPNFQLELNVTLENATDLGVDFALPPMTMNNVLMISLNQTSTRQCFSVEALVDDAIEGTEELVFSLSCNSQSQELPVFVGTNPVSVFIKDRVSTCVAVFEQSVSGAGNCLEALSSNSTVVLCCGTVAPNDTTCAFGLCISCIDYNTEVGFEKLNYTVVEGMTVEVCVSLRGGIVSQNFQLKLNVATENATGIDFTLPEATIGNTLIQLSLNQTSTRQCFSVEALMDQPPIVDDNEVVMFSLSCSPDPPELPVFIDTRPATVVIQDFGVILNDMFASQETNVTMANIEEVVSSVTTLTNQSVMGVSTQTEENLNTVATVFDGVARLLGVSASMSTNLTTETNTQIVMGLVDTIGSVLQWDPEVLAVNGSDIIRAFESVAAAYADRTILSVTVEITTADVAFVAENINTTVLQGSGRSFSSVESSSGVPDPATGGAMTPDTLAPNQTAFINLPASLFDRVPENRTNIGVFFALYDNPSLFPVAEAEVENSTRVITVLSPVIAATVGPGLFFMNLDPPISILLRLRELGEDEIMSFGSERCVSWNFSANGGEGNWTADGCETIGLVDGVVTCQCDHLTNFAILVDICSRINGSDCTPPPALTKALEVLTIIGVSLSLFGLVMTIITLTIVKKFRERDATKYHVQLCIAMICMLLVFITGINRTAVYGGCVLVSVLIHYFTLVAVLWMAAEALLMFQKLVIIFVSITTKYLVTISILCWTIPIVPVIIPLIVDLTTRPEQDIVVNRDQFCFLNHPGAFFGAFLGPIFALLIFNVVVFIWVIVVLVRHTKDTAERQKQQGMKKETAIRLVISISGIMFLFGLTWLFGALTITIRAVNLLFQVLFVVFNSLQGFFIFLFFCVFNKEGRDFWKEVLSCGRYKSELLHPSQAKYVSSGNQAHTEKKKKNEKKSSTDLQDTASTAVKSYNDSSLSYDTLDRTKDSDIPLVNIADDTKQVMTGEDIDPSTAQTIKGTLQSEKDTAVDILKE